MSFVMKEAFFSAIGDCLNSLETAQVYVVTPNEIGGYAKHMCTTSPPGISFSLHEGQIRVPDHVFAKAMLTTEPDTLDRAVAIMSVEATAANFLYTPVTKGVHIKKDREGGNVLLTYAGLRAFNSSLNFIQDITHQHPDTHVFTIMCDCDEERRMGMLQPFLDDGRIKGLWVTKSCGGQVELHQTIEEILRVWRKKV